MSPTGEPSPRSGQVGQPPSFVLLEFAHLFIHTPLTKPSARLPLYPLAQSCCHTVFQWPTYPFTPGLTASVICSFPFNGCSSAWPSTSAFIHPVSIDRGFQQAGNQALSSTLCSQTEKFYNKNNWRRLVEARLPPVCTLFVSLDLRCRVELMPCFSSLH